MKKGLFLIITLFAGLTGFSQRKYTISGTIKDHNTGETLIGASVTLLENPESGALSNRYGFYSISAPTNNYTLIASYSGYKNDTLKISLQRDTMRSIELVPEGTQLQEVVVIARRSDNITQTLPGVQKVSIEEIKNVPVLFGEKDILKTIQLLPGIKSAGDGSSGFFVRGGAADQHAARQEVAVRRLRHAPGHGRVQGAVHHHHVRGVRCRRGHHGPEEQSP